MITIAHSPDADDYFLFWALVNNKIDLEGLTFSFDQYDTNELNNLATQNTYDVIAISVAAYPQIAENYMILPHGASIGRNYGPVVVSKSKFSSEEMSSLRVGVPGNSTTAAAVLRQLSPTATTVEYAIKPFNLGFSALDKGDVDALLLIHEGQISYRERGLNLIVDLGKWWTKQTGLPLPLGINAINRKLGKESIIKTSRVLQNSINYAFAHREELLPDLEALNKSRKADVKEASQICSYLDMYANKDTLLMDNDCKKAIELLLSQTAHASFEPASIEYAPS